MDTSLPQLPPSDQAAPAKVCRLLRTKTAFGFTNDDIPWETGESTTAVYWCLGTMETAGPDDQYCHPHTCGPHRACYKASSD